MNKSPTEKYANQEVKKPMPAKKFIPALRFKILTPLLDHVLNVFLKDTEMKSQLVTQLNLKDNEKILDFGCGTGTLAVMIKKAKPDCAVTGVDVDPQVLEIAQRKALLKQTEISFLEYGGIALPFADECFDKVATSLVIHHLSTNEKHTAFKEIYRVLKKGGELHIFDFGVPNSRYAKILAFIFRYIEPIADNIQGKIPKYLSDTGFENVKEINSKNTLLGTVSFYSSQKPS